MNIKIRKILAVLVTVAMLCAMVPAGAIVFAADNLVVNGDFESSDLSAYTVRNSAAVSTTLVHGGAQSLYAPAATGSYAYAVRQNIAVEANADYVVSFWYSYVSTVDHFRLLITDGTNTLHTVYCTDTAATAGVWKQAVYSFNTGSNTTIQLKFGGGSSGYSAVYIDDVVMTAADSGDEPEVTITPDETVAGNLVVNGHFNDGNADSWTVAGGVIEAYNGDYMLKATTSDKYASVAKQTISVDTNSDYTLDMNALYVGAATKATARVHVYAGTTTNNLVNTYYWTIKPGVMTAHQFSFNTGSNTQVTINVEQYASDGTTTDGNIYYDDFVMLKVIPKPEGNATPSNDGYITNGDFETGDLTGWTVEKGGNVTWTEVATGNFALQGTATAKYDAFVSQTVTVEKNTDYVITFKAKLAAAGGQPRFEVYGGSTRLNGGNYYFTGSTSWQTFQTAFNSGDNTTVVLKPGQGVDNGGDVYYDDIVMEKSSGYQGTAQQEKTIGADVRMMIYNVLADDDADTGFSFGKTLSKLLNGAEGTRDGAAASSIAYYAPDIVAFQEFTTNWYTGIRNALPNYEFINSTLDGKADYLCTALAYNKDTIELLNTELYAFTKNRWGNQRMRYMNIGFFKVKATGEEFIAISIHTDAGYLKDDPNKANQDINGDGIAEEADGYWRQFQIQEMIAKLNELTTTYKLPILCGGDYNSGLTGYYNDSTSYPQLIDAGFKDSTEGVAIDHIIYNGMANHLYNVIITDAAVAKNVTSDHSPVMADFQFLDEYSTPIASVVNNIKQQGRNTLKNGTLWLDFSASGIEFTANCEGTVALNLTVNSIKNTDATYGGVYFTVIVDGNKKDRALCRITETGTVTLTLAENLPAGNHTFEVYRQTEHRGAEIGISSITMNGTIGTKPADSNVYIEFIGDSISTGYGALGTSSSAGDANSPLYQDATVAYPYLTAKALGADFSDVCYSGIGAKYGWQDPNMHTFYPYQRWQYDRTTQYNFNSRQPNVVVIALGTNDIAMESEKGITVEQRLTGYQEFLDLVRAKNPNSKIIWIYGMMKDDDNARIPQIIENNGGAAAGLYSLELTTNTAGAGYHPSEAGQKKFAEELVAFINNNRLLSVTEMEDTDNLISYDGSSVMEATNGKLGVGYLFNAKISGVTIDDTYTADYTNAKAIINGVEYKLLGMGAVMTNQTSVGNNDDLMKLVSVNDKSVIDVPAVKVAVANADDCQFAVRIKNIPENHSVTAIYARPYYVIEMDGEETVVYGQTVARSYEGKLDINDGELEW